MVPRPCASVPDQVKNIGGPRKRMLGMEVGIDGDHGDTLIIGGNMKRVNY